MHIIWVTGGLGCDGDSIAITAATQPSLEDLVLGAIPDLPAVHLHHPVLAYENGDEFLESWYLAAEGRLGPFLFDQRHPWNQTTVPRRQKRDFQGKYTWVMSPRWYDKRTGEFRALDSGGGPLARLWVSPTNAPSRPARSKARFSPT